MELAQDLLYQAHFLAANRGHDTPQADRRRAISTAYYALFHLLVEDGGKRWQGSSPAAATGIERAFSHGAMKQSSIRFKGSEWVDWHDIKQAVPTRLQRVASAFVELQEARHTADYNNHKQWTFVEVAYSLNLAGAAIADWISIRNDAVAGDYLLSMLLGSRK